MVVKLWIYRPWPGGPKGFFDTDDHALAHQLIHVEQRAQDCRTTDGKELEKVQEPTPRDTAAQTYSTREMRAASPGKGRARGKPDN